MKKQRYSSRHWKGRFLKRVVSTSVSVAALLTVPVFGYAQNIAIAQQDLAQPEEVTREGAWELVRGANLTYRRMVVLAPKSEQKPALSIRLIPDSFHGKPGNAAIYYLKAGGFFEQTGALIEKQKFEEDARKAMADENTSDAPPYVWLETELKDLPIDQVKEYLKYTSFQPLFLEEAAARRLCDFDRQIKSIENPVAYLIPEIQAIRMTARLQALRFLVAVGEDRVDDAVKILGQMISMGPHLCQEPFLVSALVGTACASIGWQQAFYLSEHPDAPNLYWAIASLPNPLINLEHSLAIERELLFEQLKLLREVDDSPKPIEYWSDFIDRFIIAGKGIDQNFDELVTIGKAGATLLIGSNIPSAKSYLVDIEGMSKEKLDSLPNTQVFFLAMRRFYERYRDEEFKLSFLPAHARGKVKSSNLPSLLQQYGLFSAPTGVFLPAVQAAGAASQRAQQQMALWQTIESIRHHLATNNNQLPASLSDLELPAPHDPLTNQPFEYLVHSSGATLKGAANSGNLRYQFELRTKAANP